MNKILVLIIIGLFFIRSDAQNNYEYYKVYELNISDWNKLTSNENFDFGYNYSSDLSKAITSGYYLWIDNTWYKVGNENEIFLIENESPLYFKIDKDAKKELQIKDSIGSIYTYKVDLLEPYIVPELIYNTNLDVYKNVAIAKSFNNEPDVSSVSSLEGENVLDNQVNGESFYSNDSITDDVRIANAEAMLFSTDSLVNTNQETNHVETIIDTQNEIEIEIDKPKAKINFFVAPNIELTTAGTNVEVLTFDLFEYYNKFFGSSIISSSLNPTEIHLSNTDLEYQVTSFDESEIEIIEISKSGVLKYKIIDSNSSNKSFINVRFLIL